MVADRRRRDKTAIRKGFTGRYLRATWAGQTWPTTRRQTPHVLPGQGGDVRGVVYVRRTQSCESRGAPVRVRCANRVGVVGGGGAVTAPGRSSQTSRNSTASMAKHSPTTPPRSFGDPVVSAGAAHAAGCVGAGRWLPDSKSDTQSPVVSAAGCGAECTGVLPLLCSASETSTGVQGVAIAVALPHRAPCSSATKVSAASTATSRARPARTALGALVPSGTSMRVKAGRRCLTHTPALRTPPTCKLARRSRRLFTGAGRSCGTRRQVTAAPVARRLPR